MSNLSKTAAEIDEILNGKRRSIATQESAKLGPELIDATGWTLGAGWAGDISAGFTHTAGNVATLSRTMPATGLKKYQIEFDVNSPILPDEIYVSIGNSLPFDLYFGGTHITCGITSLSNGDLVFTPTSGSTKSITNISVKEITDISLPVKNILDNNNEVSFELRTSKADLLNVFIGSESGQFNTTGVQNVGIGNKSLTNNLSGFVNIAIGANSLLSNTAGSRNIAIGCNALCDNISGHRNQAIGSFALQNNTIGDKNTAIGSDCLDHNTTGSYNVAIGFSSMYSNTTGGYNTAIGVNTMPANVSGLRNVAIGWQAQASGNAGNDNIFIGQQAGTKTTGSENTIIGSVAMYQNTSGVGNVAIGYYAGKGSAAGNYSNNVFIGSYAGAAVTTAANGNIFIGFQAGDGITTGANNLIIGYNCDAPTATTSDYLNIGNLITGLLSGAKYMKVDGYLKATLSSYSDNAAALAGGLVTNDLYRTATGEVRIVI